ncbi:hypothetical protein [Peteryoungia algae]|uniref:Uncharacterized protein n=1 Tax=Peteryoungia algae TaxID=2919917 RepID=A0ABT0CZE0_9HYPH|nr:hypothetical protein [Rhizobium sp. SSM4.3]MCJ8238542.1 hypothetical protein [Rhizobium sp. SSM4.3]
MNLSDGVSIRWRITPLRDSFHRVISLAMKTNGTTIAATEMTARAAASFVASVPNSLLLLGLIRGCRVH